MSRGKTVSIVIPDTLKNELQRAADKLSIPRSRYIANLLLNWQEQRSNATTIPELCEHLHSGNKCDFFKTLCTYPLTKQDTCTGYYEKEPI
ncbi:MAG: hypothetical protein DRJ07_13445, partial [Bacteroidetes bacterium]